MNILKRFFAWFSVLLLFIGLIGLAWSVVGQLTLRDKDTVKGWLENGGVYENITDTVLETTTKDVSDEDADINANNQIINKAVDDAFSPEFIRENTELVLDSVYAWLNGETEKLTFKIELKDAKTNFIEAVAGYAAERAPELPVCKDASAAQDFDPINATCTPPGFTADDIAAEVKNQLTENEDFLEKTSFGASDIKVGENDQLFTDSEIAANIKKTYRYTAFAPFIFGVTALLGLIGAIFLSPRKLFGIRRAGGTFVSSGVILGISWVFLRLGQSISTSNISTPSDNNASDTLVSGIIKEVTQGIAQVLIWFVVGYIVIGIGMLIWAGIKKRGQTPPEDTEKSQIEEQKSEPSKLDDLARTHKPPVKPRGSTPPPRRKIQL